MDVIRYTVTELLPSAVGGVLGALVVLGWLHLKDR